MKQKFQDLLLLVLCWVMSWLPPQANSDPHFLLQHKTRIAYPGKLYVDGNILLSISLETGPNGVSILDISEPANPRILAEHSAEELGIKLVNWDIGVAFTTGTAGVNWPCVFIPDLTGMNVFDFSNPAAPEKIWNYPGSQDFYFYLSHCHICVRGNTALFVYPEYEKTGDRMNQYAVCEILDLRDIHSPIPLSKIRFGREQSRWNFSQILWDGGDWAFLSSEAWTFSSYRSLTEVPYPSSIWVLDLSDRLKPQAQLFGFSDKCGIVVCINNRLYVRAFKDSESETVPYYTPYWISFDINQPLNPNRLEENRENEIPSYLQPGQTMHVLFSQKGGNNTLIHSDNELLHHIFNDFPVMESSGQSLTGYRHMKVYSSVSHPVNYLMAYQLSASSSVSNFSMYE